MSDEANKVLEKATKLAGEMGDQYVSLEHILLGLLSVKDPVSGMLKDAGMTEKETRAAIDELRKGSKVNSQSAEDNYDALGRYAINLNERARNGKLDPVIGRDDEIRRVLQILSRRTKNNPILIGEPGVGKTAIAEGLAQRIVNGDVPSNLASKSIYSLDMGALRARNVTPEQIIGYCAWLLRLQPTPIPCKPADLLADFSWEPLRANHLDRALKPDDPTTPQWLAEALG